jgi:hypothetical protein
LKHYQLLKKGLDVPTNKIDLELAELDEEVIKRQHGYYQSFYKKWVSRESKNVCVVFTEDIERNPQKVISQIFLFLKIDSQSGQSAYTKHLLEKTCFKNDLSSDVYDRIKEIVFQ